MHSSDFGRVCVSLFSELAIGAPDADATYMLNRGDKGLLASLENISAEQASLSHAGGGSIAAHADHLRYGFALLNRWARGERDPWAGADWTESWRKTSVTNAEWGSLRQELRREVTAWLRAVGVPRELGHEEACWVVGSIPHLAYHLGAIRQIARGTRGPTAEDEQRLKRNA